MPIPVDAQLVQAFVNTRNVENRTDDLDAWLARHGLRVTSVARRRAADVREALRALLLENNGIEAEVGSAASVLAEAARRARLELRFEGGAPRLVPTAGGVDGMLGGVLVAVAAAAADGTWERLKACRAETCRWVFYDQARNRSRTWCSMEVCGNRAKARAYRARH
jgi:predicted RNA-binding Zn ribbon-like protein